MKKFFFAGFLFFSLFCFAEEPVIVKVELPYGLTTLQSTFFCFNELETGQKIADRIFRRMNLQEELKKGGFKKLMAVPPGSEISAYNYSIMSYGREFWFFENRDDGWLWGTGRY